MVSFEILISCNNNSIEFIIEASRRVGLNFQEILLNVSLTTVDTATQREIEMFLVAIEKNPPTM